MEVHLTPEQEAELNKLATRKGRNANEWAPEVIGFYLEHEVRFIEAVESFDRGEYVSQEEVGARINRLFPSQMQVRCSPEAAEDLERIGRLITRQTGGGEKYRSHPVPRDRRPADFSQSRGRSDVSKARAS